MMSTSLENNPHESLYKAVVEPWKKVLFIFNPVAGKSQIRTDIVDILDILSRDAYVVTCYPTKCRGDARNVVRSRTEDYLYVICAGGDGTLDEVVTGMMENQDKPFVPIGYIPAGTTNDFANSLGIPSDMKEAARVVARGKRFDCDLGRFNDDMYFTYVAAFGIFTETSYETPQDLKNLLGHMAYIMQGVMDLGKIRTYHFSVESDELSISDEFVFGMITNSKSVGGFMDITGNRVDMCDGLFEVTLIKMPTNILELGEIVQYLNRTIDTSDFVYQFKTSHIVMESQERVKWTRDGEYGGTYKRVEITNLRESFKILVPRDK
jgi:YegS/Rv2252/BmrU family lipid kinase